MTNRIANLFQHKKNILSIYFTAGFPLIADTSKIIKILSGTKKVDLIEIGIPYSDPIADGETIQKSSSAALKNGITLSLIFEQIKEVRQSTDIPLILMGYVNSVMQFGVEEFCKKSHEVQIDGVILPDLPIEYYTKNYRPIFEKYNLQNIMLITPQTSEARIREIDQLSSGFIYVVSTASVTGKSNGFSKETIAYFEKIKSLHLKSPMLLGFGVSNKDTFDTASTYFSGGIIGSAFIRVIEKPINLEKSITEFVHLVKSGI